MDQSIILTVLGVGMIVVIAFAIASALYSQTNSQPQTNLDTQTSISDLKPLSPEEVGDPLDDLTTGVADNSKTHSKGKKVRPRHRRAGELDDDGMLEDLMEEGVELAVDAGIRYMEYDVMAKQAAGSKVEVVEAQLAEDKVSTVEDYPPKETADPIHVENTLAGGNKSTDLDAAFDGVGKAIETTNTSSLTDSSKTSDTNHSISDSLSKLSSGMGYNSTPFSSSSSYSSYSSDSGSSFSDSGGSGCDSGGDCD